MVGRFTRDEIDRIWKAHSRYCPGVYLHRSGENHEILSYVSPSPNRDIVTFHSLEMVPSSHAET